MNDWKALGAAALAGTALQLGGTAEAQSCYVTDGLDAGCCDMVTFNGPQFSLGLTSLQGSGVCWDACVVGPKMNLKFSVTPFSVGFSTPCTQAATVMVTDPSDPFSIPLLLGDGLLNFLSSWEEVTPAGTNLQVWRYHLKVDLATTPGAPLGLCSIPPCLDPQNPLAHPTAFYYGYVDYAEDCNAPGSGAVQHALVLFHGCDRLSHDPLLSSTPGVFHPTTQYALVAPDTASNPFAFAPSIPPTGPLVGEAMRRRSDSLATCFAESPIASGGVANLIAGCLCPLSFNPTLQTARRLLGTSTCTDPIGTPGSFGTRNFYPSAPWFHMVTTSIGSWTTSISYPGAEAVYADEGLFDHYETCDDPLSVFPSGPSIDLFYGSTTKGGYTVVPNPGTAQTDEMTGLVSNHVILPGVPLSLPILGTVQLSQHFIMANY